MCPQAEVKGRSLVSKPTTQSSRRYAELMPTQAMLAIPKLQRRLDDLKQWPAPSSPEDAWSQSSALATKINATVREVFGADTVEAAERSISVTQFTYNIMHFDRPAPFSKNLEAFENGRKSAIIHLQAILDLVIEKAEDATPSSAHQRVLKAYQGLDLHPAIADAASELYIDGHYSNAIEDAVKALNNLVRLKSGLELDGDKLMTTAFSVEKPRICFNDLIDQSDKDEQRGFMMMFAGAVAGLRNPRAHKLIKDDAERALEFIAYISLLAKIIGDAKKVRQAMQP